MKKLVKRISSVFLMLTAALSVIQIPSFADVAISGEKDDVEVKEFLRTRAMRNEVSTSEMSAWDMNQIGGEVYHGSSTLTLKDTSAVLPVEALREMEPITYGDVVMNFNLIPTNQMTDASVQLRNGDSEGIYLGIDRTYFWVNSTEGRKNIIPYKSGSKYNVHIVIHMDSKTFDIYVDYHLYEQNVPYNAERFDNFFISSGNASIGDLGISYIFINRGYLVNSNFDSEDTASAYGWSVVSDVKGGGVRFNGRAQFIAENGTSKLINTFEREERDFTADFVLNINKKRSGIAVELIGDEKSVLKITVDKNGFNYEDASGKPVRFYGDYMENLPYVITAHVNFSSRSFDLYVNDKIKAENAALKSNVNAVDSLAVTGEASDSSFEFSDALVYPTERFDDYAPEAQAVESPGVDVCMQYFNLWDEYKLYGWDTINESEYRRPVLGFFDETNVERMEWDLKYMAEHGVDFMWFCGYPPSPVEKPGPRDFFYTPRYYFQAKNSQKVQFALLMENAGWAALPASHNPDENLERYLQNVGRHMIEYYFKDSRYYTANGRPLVGVYNPKNFINSFGAEYAGRFIERLGDMCEAEGISRPIFVAPNKWDVSDELFTESGFEGYYEYHNRAGYPVDNLARMKKAYEDSQAAGVGYIPTVDAGFDDYAWHRGTGFSFNADWLEWSLQKTKDEILTLKDKVFETPIINLATWSEYGEGHYFAPTTYYGFSYMDAVRNVFTNETGEHEDIIPSEHQKDRFNNQYPHWREVNLREVNVGEKPAENSYEKYKWEFNSEAEKGWKEETIVPGVVSSGVWTLTAGRDALITLSDEGIDTSDVTHIRVRMKNNGTAYYSTTRITTPFDEYEDPAKAFNFAIPVSMQNMTEFEDYYIPVGKYPEIWRGTLNSLSITFGGFENGDKLEIDEIAFMAKAPEDKVRISINGWSSEIDSVMQDGLPMVKLRDIADKLDAEVYYEGSERTVYVRYGDTVTGFVPGSGEAVCDGKKYTLPEASKLLDDSTWINVEMISLMFKKNMSWNEEEKILSLKDNDKVTAISRDNSERELLYEEHFETGSSVAYTSQPAAYTLSNSALTHTSSGTDPQIVVNVPTVDISKAKIIELGVMSDTSVSMQVFFAAANNTAFAEARSFKTQVGTSNGYKAYSINTALNSQFDGKLTRLRIDPGNISGSTVSIDYIRIYGDFETELSDEELLRRADSRRETFEGLVWDFDINNDRDGWIFSKSMANVNIIGGMAKADIISSNPFMETAQDSLSVSCGDYKSLEFSLRNTMNAEKIKVYYTTDKQKSWSEDKCFEVLLSKNNKTNVSYNIDLTQGAYWSGNVNALRLVFSGAPNSSVEIDYIKLKH